MRRITHFSALIAVLVGLATLNATATAAQVAPAGAAKIEGEIHWSEDLSAMTLCGQRLVFASDEGNKVQIAQKVSDTSYQTSGDWTITLRSSGADSELDIEALTSSGPWVYALGSHSYKRKKMKDDKTYDENMKRLKRVELEASRDILARFKLDANGKLVDGSLKSTSLRKLIEKEGLLKEYAGLPGKENGVDAEGLTVDGDGNLYVGFRGPVLRHGLVPVLKLKLKDGDNLEIDQSELLLAQAGGLGIRDMQKVDGGFLLLAGPVTECDAPFRIYFWNGKDCVIGPGGPGGQSMLLGEVRGAQGGSAESMVILSGGGAGPWKILVLFDGPAGGAPAIFSVSK